MNIQIEDACAFARTVTRAPFGVGFSFDPAEFSPLDDWPNVAPGAQTKAGAACETRVRV